MENTLQHEEVERLRSLGNPKEKLEEQFDNGGAKLDKDDWFKVDYASIVDWKEQMKLKREISFESEKVKAKLLDDEEESKLWNFGKDRNPTLLLGVEIGVLSSSIPIIKREKKLKSLCHLIGAHKLKFLNSNSKKIAVTKGHSMVATIELGS